MTDHPLPFDLTSTLRRFGYAGELLEEAGLPATVAEAWSDFETAATRAETVKADADLSPLGRAKRIRELLGSAREAVDKRLRAPLTDIERSLAQARQGLTRTTAPADPTTAPSRALYDLFRAIDSRAQLAALPPTERVRVAMAQAQSGNLLPVLGAESSLTELLPAEVVARAREVHARAADKPLAESIDLLEKQKQATERIVAEFNGLADQRTRALEDGLPAPEPPSLEERIAAAQAERQEATAN